MPGIRFSRFVLTISWREFFKVADEQASLIAEIKKLVEKLDAPKKADWSQKIAAVTPFLSTVVLAGFSLWITWSYQQGQVRLAQETAKHDQAFRDAQVRVAELEAISKLIPALSSKDPTERKRAEELLQAVQQSKPISASELEVPLPSSSRREKSEAPESRKSVIDSFVVILASDAAAEERRIDAAKSIATAVKAPSTPASERRHAVEALSKVAESSTAPPSVRKAARFAIADIRNVDASQIAALVENEPITRKIEEVILHHSSNPSAGDYKGYPTIRTMVEIELGSFNWERLNFHYAVAPDGTIWIGMPLNDLAFHLGYPVNRNPTTVSVMLIMDGNIELPTPAQQAALVELLKALFAKLIIKAADNFAPGHGFHSDYNSRKSCPGKLMTKEKVLSWIAGQGSRG